jgi:hypothetical protein
MLGKTKVFNEKIWIDGWKTARVDGASWSLLFELDSFLFLSGS